MTPAPPPPFAPAITYELDGLTAGGTPTLKLRFLEVANERAIQSFETRIDSGRTGFANLTAGKILGEGTFEDESMPVVIRHVVVSNDGTTVRTQVTAPAFGNAALADGLIENTGADGARFLLTIPTDPGDDGIHGETSPVELTIGKIWILPAQAGKTFTITTTATSVKINGVAVTSQSTQSFTTVP